MSHFAEIDSDGNVLRVIVADSKEWCESRLGGTWIQTSYNASIRKNYAGIGYKYDSDLDAFVPPQPAYNYDFDTYTARWVFPDDNHLYIPAAPHIAEPLSRGLYKLVVPDGEGLYAGIIPHPTGEQHPLLQCRSTDVVPVNIAADYQLLSDTLQITVDEQALTQQEKDAVVQAVVEHAGQVVNLIDFIPQSWQPYVMDKAGAIAAGYFPELAPAP